MAQATQCHRHSCLCPCLVHSQEWLSYLFELRLLEKLWSLGPCSVREIQESLPQEHRPAYATVQTMIYRLEQKGAVKRVKRVGNANISEAV